MKNPKYKQLAAPTERGHCEDWLPLKDTGVIAAVLFNAQGSAERAAVCVHREDVIKELFKGESAYGMKEVDNVISELDSKVTPDLVVFNSIKDISVRA